MVRVGPRPDAMDPVEEVYRRLLAAYGPQRWWPADTPFEVIVGALLMQQTSWRNVAEAIARLKAARLLDTKALADASLQSIRAHVRVAGLYRTKPSKLRSFCRHLVARSGGDLSAYFDRPLPEVRADLLAQDGVGPETADSILLYAGRHAVFVVDTYTVRIGTRLGLFAADDYSAVQRFFEDRVPRDVDTYREYHALLVEHAKRTCRPRPRCDACALRSLCAYARARKA